MTGDQLRSLREARGLTRHQLADELGDCSHSTINKWERGISPVPSWVMDKMLRRTKLEVSLEDLLLLLERGKELGATFSQILGEAVHEYLHKSPDGRDDMTFLAATLADQNTRYNAGHTSDEAVAAAKELNSLSEQHGSSMKVPVPGAKKRAKSKDA